MVYILLVGTLAKKKVSENEGSLLGVPTIRKTRILVS